MTLAKIKFILASVLILGLAAALFLERQASHKLRLELAALQSQVDDLKARSALEDASGSTKVNADELTRLRAEHSELLRLRGEVSRLRSVQAETGKLQAEITRMRATQANFSPNSASQEPVDPEKDVYKSAGIAKLTYGRAWGIALAAFAQANGDRIPETFEQASAFYPKDAVVDSFGLAPEVFEIVFRGSLREITKPASTIILREKASFANFRKPGFSKTYVFADGHSEIHSTPDGNFEQWEKERMVPVRQP